jgi:hypothetical protein
VLSDLAVLLHSLTAQMSVSTLGPEYMFMILNSVLKSSSFASGVDILSSLLVGVRMNDISVVETFIALENLNKHAYNLATPILRIYSTEILREALNARMLFEHCTGLKLALF